MFLASLVIGGKIIVLSKEAQHLKQDYSDINNIKYGLFSINQWKEQLSVIINAEIANLDLSGNKKQIKPLLEAQLNQLINSVDKKIKDKNKKTTKGKLKQAFINAFVDIDDIKAGIPQYADDIIKIMQRPKTKKTLKGLISEKVDSYFEGTFQAEDVSRIESIVQKLEASDKEEAKAKLNIAILDKKNEIFTLTWILLGLALTLFVVSGYNAVLPSTEYIVLVMMLFILLISGVMVPMIDLEAKISEMSFTLFEHSVKFVNQILYFQSKSVLDVFWIMITHHDIQMKIVGILMVLFSVVFPIAKLVSSVAYYYNRGNIRNNKIIQFFVLKSGKWSMTDVMIIAIFMAYIGFNGIISSQFGKLNSVDEELVLLATNGTSLQPGFYLFLGYTVLALFLSEFMTRKNQKPFS